MAHDGTGTGWDVTAPADSDAQSSGDDEIRDLRKGVAIRANKEHVDYAASSVGGQHVEGSAMAYYVATTAPTTQPGGDALSAADEGRIYVDSDDSNNTYVYTGSAWAKITGAADGAIGTTQIADDAVDKDKIALDVAGDGLGQNANGSLEVNTAGGLETSSDNVQIADAGVTAEKLEPDAKTLHASVYDSKATTTDGGSSVASTWTKRDLTTILVQHEDTGVGTGGSWLSLASSQITLAKGVYFVNIAVPGHDTGLHQALLYDTTGAADLLPGTSVQSDTTGPKTTLSLIVGMFTLSAQSVLEIRHYTSVTKAANGFGIAADTGKAEIYTVCHIMRLGDGD